MKSIITALLFAIASSASAQAPPPVTGMPPRPPAPDHRLPPPAPLETVEAFTGRIGPLLQNDDRVYDAFYLLSGSDSLLVKFPPHLGSQVVDALKTGAPATVQGVGRVKPGGGQEIHMLSATSNGRTVRDTATMTNPPAAESDASGSGRITALVSDPEGRLKAVVVSDRFILHVAPEAAQQLAGKAQKGAEIAFTGLQKPVRKGEVSTGSYTIVHGKTVTLGGQQYLVQ